MEKHAMKNEKLVVCVARALISGEKYGKKNRK
jgi:hypothetical protein